MFKTGRIYSWRILEIYEWSVAMKHFVPPRARQDVTDDLMSFLSAHHLGLAKYSSKDDVIIKLKEVLEKFENLINSDRRDEESIKQFIKDNRILIDPQAVEIIFEHQLGSEYRADIVTKRSAASGPDYTLIELEPSNLRWFTKSGDFRAEANHAIRQVKDWQD